MIKALNKYSGLVQIVVLIVGVFVAINVFAVEFSNELKDVTTDIKKVRTEVADAARLISDSIKVSNNIVLAMQKQEIHAGYSRKAAESQAKTNIELFQAVTEMNGLLRRFKNNGYFEISKRENGQEN